MRIAIDSRFQAQACIEMREVTNRQLYDEIIETTPSNVTCEVRRGSPLRAGSTTRTWQQKGRGNQIEEHGHLIDSKAKETHQIHNNLS